MEYTPHSGVCSRFPEILSGRGSGFTRRGAFHRSTLGPISYYLVEEFFSQKNGGTLRKWNGGTAQVPLATPRGQGRDRALTLRIQEAKLHVRRSSTVRPRGGAEPKHERWPAATS